MSDDIRLKIRQLKGLDEGPLNNFRLEITKPNGELMGWFSPLTIHSITDESLIQNLTDWRSLHKQCFFTQFDPTTPRTKEWLRTMVIPDDSKILFIICDANGIPIGNYGLRNIYKASAELDNILLGDSKSRGPFVLLAMKIFIEWVFFKFGFMHLNGSVFKNNQPSVLVHKRLGFRIINELPMKRIENYEMIQYVPIGAGDKPDAYILEMRIEPCQK